METHRFETHVAFYRGSQGRGAVVLYGNRHFEQIQNPFGAGHGALEQVNHLGKAGERPQQALGQKHQHAVSAHVKAAVQRHHATNSKGGEKARQNRHADNRNKRRTDFNRAAVGFYIGFTGIPQPLGFPRFTGEAFNRSDTAEIVGETAGKVAYFFAHVAVQRPGFALEEKRAPNDQRNRRKR